MSRWTFVFGPHAEFDALVELGAGRRFAGGVEVANLFLIHEPGNLHVRFAERDVETESGLNH
jgi:hypothetical protein